MRKNTNHRGDEIGDNHLTQPQALVIQRRAKAAGIAASTGGKLVYGDPLDVVSTKNRPIYSLPEFDREVAPEVTTRFRKFAPTLHDPYTGEYATMRTPTFTRAGANRKAARAAEHYAQWGYIK